MYMRNVQCVSAESLRWLRSAWTATHPLLLSDRVVPEVVAAELSQLNQHKQIEPSAVADVDINSKKRGRGETTLAPTTRTCHNDSDSAGLTGTDVSNNAPANQSHVNAAKARFLARKTKAL